MVLYFSQLAVDMSNYLYDFPLPCSYQYLLQQTMKSIIMASAVLIATVFLASHVLKPEPAEPAELYDYNHKYLEFAKKFGKVTKDIQEFTYRARIFKNFRDEMSRHNADPSQKWKMGVNQFSDMTKDEFVALYLGEKQADAHPEFKEEPVNAGYAGEIDWRTRDIITAVKNQGKCGSCWAFAATAAHETYQIQVRNQPKTIVLSEQQLVDCSTAQPYGNTGCNGGYGVRALEYIKDFGQTVNSSYPYMAVNQDCKTPTGSYKTYGVSQIAGCSEIDTTIHRRPMAVRVDASNWHLYASGIFDNCDTKLNHAVFLVGSTDEYWIIKNSWSDAWGEKGYIRLKKGNTCGVCTGPSFPI